MLATQTLIDALAERIERTYRLRRPGWNGACSTPRVWTWAATILLRIHERDHAVPLDPELFVAAQPGGSPYPDPWRELTQPSSALRYRRRVRAIVRALRRELTAEVKRAEARIASGQPIARVLSTDDPTLSSLGKYIVAYRAGRPALATRFEDGVKAQHWTCPLYRQAIRNLLPPDIYPVPPGDEAPTAPLSRRPKSQVHLN